MTTICLDADLVRRYGGWQYARPPCPGPAHATAAFSESDYRRCASAGNQLPIPPGLSLLLDAPPPGSHAARDVTPFCALVQTETAIHGGLFDDDRQVDVLHLGCGAAAGLQPADLDGLMRCIASHFDLRGSGGARRTATLPVSAAGGQRLAALAALGVDRIELTAWPDPARSRSTADQEVAAARKAGIALVDVALLCPAPGQSASGCLRTLDRVIASRPDSIRLVRRPPDDTDQPVGQLRGDDLAAYTAAIERLASGGYELLGLDHFARSGHHLLAARAAGTLRYDLLGFGRGAPTDIVPLGTGSPGAVGACQLINHSDIKHYGACLAAGHLPIGRGWVASADQRCRWAIFQRLACSERLDFGELEAMLAVRWPQDFDGDRAAIETMARDGLVRITDTGIELRPPGRLLLPAVATAFLGARAPDFMQYAADC